MPFVIQMPKLGHTMTEGTVLKWHKHEGEVVCEGESILTVETDKAEVEVESPTAGLLARRIADEGEVVAVGGPLGEIQRDGESAVVSGPRVAAASSAANNDIPAAPERKAAPSAPPSSPAPRARVLASPRAKRLAAERGVDLARVAGSGEGGMVTEDDVRAFAAGGERPHVGSAASTPTGASAPAASPPSDVAAAHREKLTRIQQAGARNLAKSWSEVPHFVQMVRVDMSRALDARRSLATSGTKVGVTDVILMAVVGALKENPRVNASYSDGELLIYDRINLGVAVDTPDGLLVPVVHDAGALDLGDLSASIADLAERARNHQLKPTDLELATFTVSNLGAYGVENGTPVIFAPQAALMFVGSIHDEVLAVEGRAEVRPAMQIAIAYDHRALDGATASRFTTKVKALLEAPDFLGVAASPGAVTHGRHRDVTIDAVGDTMRTQVSYRGRQWSLDGDDAVGADPVSSFLGALGSCLLMSLRVAARVRKIELGRASVHAVANEKGHVKEIKVQLKVETPVDDERLHRLVEVAERGCHVRNLVRDDVNVALEVSRF
jgi:pyruvate dehydrogenase E2 component (dihydrolipoamide acetyltransferase)